MLAISNAANSRTLIATAILGALWAVANRCGVEIPWELCATGIAAIGAKETARRFAERKV